MNLSDINPHVRYARAHHLHSDPCDKYRVCYDCRIFFFAKASGTVVTTAGEYTISPGMAIYLPPETKYKFSFCDEPGFEILVVDFDLVSSFSHIKSSLGTVYEDTFVPSRVPRYPIAPELSHPIVRNMRDSAELLYQCADNFLARDAYYREKTSALVKLCIFEFMREDGRCYSELCDRVVAFVHENYADAQLTNDKVAEQFGYHPYYLNGIVKKETSKSIHRHLVDYRIEIAKNYLLTTDYSIDHISWRSGFSSTSHFIKMFREKTGTTPHKYRKSMFHL